MHFRGVNLSLVSFPAMPMQAASLTGCQFPKISEGRRIFKQSHHNALLDTMLLLLLRENRSAPQEIEREPSRWPEWPFRNAARRSVAAPPKYEIAPRELWKETWGTDDVTPTQFTTIVAQIRELKQSHEASGNPVEAGDFYFTQMELRRRFNEDGTPRNWFRKRFNALNLYRLLNGYGERPWRCLVWLVTLLFFATPVYLLSGITTGELTADGQKYEYRTINYALPHRLPRANDLAHYAHDTPAAIEYAARNMLPFIQRNDPALRPSGRTTRFLAMAQQLIGATLTAFFILALRRRFRR